MANYRGWRWLRTGRACNTARIYVCPVHASDIQDPLYLLSRQWESLVPVEQAAVEPLEAIKEKTFSAFEDFLMQVTTRSGGNISARTAAEMATQLAEGIFAPISRQIDPLLIGEAAREVRT